MVIRSCEVAQRLVPWLIGADPVVVGEAVAAGVLIVGAGLDGEGRCTDDDGNLTARSQAARQTPMNRTATNLIRTTIKR
jgi:hypothetical protein